MKTQNHTPTDKPLTLTQVANRYGVARQTMRRWLDHYDLPYTRTPGGHYRIDSREADELQHHLDEENQNGFTLLELIITIAVIGILIAIAIPIYGNSQEKAKTNSVALTADSAYKSGWASLNTRNGKPLAEVEAALNEGSDKIRVELTPNPRNSTDVCAMAQWRDSSENIPVVYKGDGCGATDFPDTVTPTPDPTPNPQPEPEPEPLVLAAPAASCSATVTPNGWNNAANITWGPVANATSYRVVVRRSGSLLTTAEVSGTSFTHRTSLGTNPPLGQHPVTITVTALAGEVESAASNTVNITHEQGMLGTRYICN